MKIGFTIDGLVEWRQVLWRAPAIVNQELVRSMQQATYLVESEAARRAPVDTGRLRASLTSRVRGVGTVIAGEVGTNVKYAAYMEYGTGRLTDWPGGGKGRHWPPGGKLEVWAKRHGFESGFVVARIIGLRGGLKPRRYLRGALQANESRIQQMFADALDRVLRRIK